MIVIDIGTSATKAILFEEDGSVLRESNVPYRTSMAGNGWHEQDPEDWWRSAITAVRELGDLRSVAAISLAGTMQNVIALDHAGEVVRPAILYSDSRAADDFRDWAPALAEAGAKRRIGNHLNEFMSVFKMLWLRRQEPAQFAKTDVIHGGAKDYVAYRLTGRHVTDPTAASTVGLMDLASRQWSPELSTAVLLDPEKLPEILDADACVGPVNEAAARALGVPQTTLVINGSGDAGASTLGAGAFEPGNAYIYLGTTAWIAVVSALDSLELPQDLFTLAHPTKKLTIRVGAMLSGGDSAAWWSELSGASLTQLDAQLPAIDRHPPDTLFLPYLKGEHCPFVDPQVRGAFLALDRSASPGQMFYAVLEGVAFALRANIDALGVGSDQVRLIGGGANSTLWPQLIADVTGRSLLVSASGTAATAFGALHLAARQLRTAPHWAYALNEIQPRASRASWVEARWRLFRDATQFARHLGSQANAMDVAP